MARLTIEILGGFQARLDAGPPSGLPRRKAKALLAYLALPPGQAHPRDKLAALLWGDLPDEHARQALRQALATLRRACAGIDPPPLRFEAETIALNPDAIQVDVEAFERRIAEGTPNALEAAVALYRGNLLEGLGVSEEPFEEWLRAERERLRELVLEALAKLLGHHERARNDEASVRTALRFLTLDPLQEAVHRSLMRVYARSGRRDSSLRQYQTCVAVLQRELGVGPEAETRELYQTILRERAKATAAKTRPAVSGRDDRTAPSIESPLVGRESELGRLRQMLDGAWNNHGRVAAILGETGVGKSRLLAEMAYEANTRGGRVLVGQGYETEQILPFGPWVDALRRGRISEDEVVLDGLSSTGRAELARLLPDISRSAATKSPGPPDYRALFESLSELMKHLSTLHPLVYLLEDLHWADEMSIRLLAFLARRVEAWPVLIVVTARDEELIEAPLLGRVLEDLEQEQRLARVVLSALSPGETATLVKSLLRPSADMTLVARVAEQAWRASAGNPFIVVEIVRALHDEPAMATIGDVDPTRGDIAPNAVPLPQRVRSVVTRRLSRLRDGSRHLLSVAALIGREFDFALLQRASELEEHEAAEGVEELVRHRLFHGVSDGFDVTHDAIRQVVIAELLRPRARRLHARIAEALESLYAGRLDPVASALGVHCEQAEVWVKAVQYLRVAGAQAVARSAHREAAAWFERARATAEHLPEGRAALQEAVDVRLDLYGALVPLGQRQRIAEHLRDAATAARQLDDPTRLARIATAQANQFRLAGDLDRALEAATLGHDISETLDDVPLHAAARFYLGVIHHCRGDYRAAADVLRRNLALPDDQGVGRVLDMPGPSVLFSRSWLAWSLSELGEFAEGITRGEEAVQRAEALDHAFTRADAYRAIGCLYVRKGDMPAALTVLERGLELARKADLALWFPSIGSLLGYAYALDGRSAEAISLLEQALERADALGIAAGHGLRSVWLGEAYLLAGRLIEASEFAARSVDLARASKERGNEGWALRLTAEVAACCHPAGREATHAESSYRQAQALASELGMRPLDAHCHAGLAKLYRATGKGEQSREHLATATTMYREMDMRFWLEKAEAEKTGLA